MFGLISNNKFTIGLALTASMILAGCSSAPSSQSRYSMKHDKGPEEPVDLGHIEDAIPKYEPYSRGGNKDYTLFGVRYEIVEDPVGFTEKGIASWYGKKFHGHKTSNGETYDMYSMTAAHKTLPLPSYVKVKNLDNGKTTIVRVNDRGPFHQGRIIDLSYAAATKLDVVRTGTANVEIEVISVNKTADTLPIKGSTQLVIQVASSKNQERISELLAQLTQKLSTQGFVTEEASFYRALVGPFDDQTLTQSVLEQIKQLGYETAFIKEQRVK